MRIYLIKNQQKNYRNQLLENLIKEKYNKRKKKFIDNIWGADLADMQLINKFNKRLRFLLCD